MKLLEIIEEPSGKLSSSRIMFVIFGLSAVVSWFLGSPFSLEYLATFLGVGGFRLGQRFAEKVPSS